MNIYVYDIFVTEICTAAATIARTEYTMRQYLQPNFTRSQQLLATTIAVLFMAMGSFCLKMENFGKYEE